jgi:hypothetical protein
MSKNGENLQGLKVPDPKRTQKALQECARNAVLTHARAGNPVATWKDGRVVWIGPEEILEFFSAPGKLNEKDRPNDD